VSSAGVQGGKQADRVLLGLYCGAVATQVIVLNGGSSSGKSAIARCLQEVLPQPWLTIGTDDFVDALPPAMQDSDGGIEIAQDGGVHVGQEFRDLESAWITGVVAMVNAGARVIVDEVFLGGAESQGRWLAALGGIDTLWVGVRCAPETAAQRETARGDRVRGMAVQQADLVHRGVTYDFEVDTTHNTALTCANMIAGRLRKGTERKP
jgi:chloramphenicol 3-O phosphotransferase